MMWILEGSNQEIERVVFRLPVRTVRTIGRSSGAQFILDAALVSRLHCQITARSQLLEVKDLESTNGTFVNGQRVQTGTLKEGDTLSIGRVDLVVSKASD